MSAGTHAGDDTATLPDFLATGRKIVSFGLNPSPPAVAAGLHFANPCNRFWRALRASQRLSAPRVRAFTGAQVFVSLNPSSANAAFSLGELVAACDELAALRAHRRGGCRSRD